MPSMTAREALESLYSVTPFEIDELAWEQVEGCEGVHQKVLWRLGDFVQALVRYEPGATSPGEPHFAAHHHLWVVSGAATIAGRKLVAGSYMHVPPKVRHPVENVGPEGVTLLQMHRAHAPQESADLVARAPSSP